MLSKCSQSYTIQRIEAFPNFSTCAFVWLCVSTHDLPPGLGREVILAFTYPMVNAFTLLSQWLIRRLLLLAVEWLTWLRSDNWMNEMLLKYCSSSARPLAQALALNSHSMRCISAFSSLYCCHSTVNFYQNWCWLLWSVCIDLTVLTRSYRH